MDIYTSRRELIKISDSPLASGGEGEIREIISGPERYKGMCVKIYYQKKRTTQQANKIKYMVENPPARVRGDGFQIAWPIEYLMDENGSFLGFLMPMAFPGSKQLVYLTTTKLSRKLSEEWYDRYDRTKGRKAVISRLKLMCNIAIPIHFLHSTNRYVLKDFKPENVLITYNGKVTIVDMDSVQIAENEKLLYMGTVATPDYIPTEAYRQGIGKNAGDILNVSWDLFALGVVFYKLLIGLHPYAVTPYGLNDADTNENYKNIAKDLFPFGENADKVESYPKPHDKFKILPLSIKNLFLRTFTSDYDNRPGTDEWWKTIYGIVKKLEIPQGQNHKPDPKTPTPTPGPVPPPDPHPKPRPEPQSVLNPTPDPEPVPPPPSSKSTGEIIVKCLLTAGTLGLAAWACFGLGWGAGMPAAPILYVTIRNIWKMDFD